LIERAYSLGIQAGLAVWCEDEAGPFQVIPHSGRSWQPLEQPTTQPHEYVRGGTTKILTLFHPATGQVRVRPAANGTNAVLHGWLKETLAAIVAALPVSAAPRAPAATRALWEAWQQDLAVPFTLPEQLPPLRILLVWDNLAGHRSTRGKTPGRRELRGVARERHWPDLCPACPLRRRSPSQACRVTRWKP
jgi:hypothetical protein